MRLPPSGIDGGILVWVGVLQVTGMGPEKGAAMKQWRVYLEGKTLGTVWADSESEAKVAAEDKYELTDDEGDLLDVDGVD